MSIRSRIKKLGIKVLYRVMQRSFCSNSGIRLRYIYMKHKPGEPLVVVFSGFAAQRQRARYNYIRTLKNSKNNLLFILDDFGYMKRGSYYLGEELDLYNSGAVQELIEYCREKSGCGSIIFTGSSKGGSAALIYGLSYPSDRVLIGSPQYRIGNYLCLNDYHRTLLEGMRGRMKTDAFIDKPNGIIEERIDKLDCSDCPEIEIVYSSNEAEFYDIEALISKLTGKGVKLTLHDEKFACHSDIGEYFIKYLKAL